MRLTMPPLCLALTAAAPCRAQRTLPDPVAAEPEYLYCEIIAEAEPGVARSGVVFDFGQRTEAWRYDYLSDSEGKALRTKHYLLRLRSLDEATRERLLAEPGTRKGSGRKSSATAGEERKAGDRAR